MGQVGIEAVIYTIESDDCCIMGCGLRSLDASASTFGDAAAAGGRSLTAAKHCVCSLEGCHW
jgi:hypothetical protein